MGLLRRPVKGGVRVIAEKLRRPVRDAAAMTAQTARHQLDRAEGAALTFGKAAQRRAGEIARAGVPGSRRSRVLTGALLLAAVTGGMLLSSARARAVLRSGVNGVGLWAAGRRSRAAEEEEPSERPLSRMPDLGAKEHQEALLDEGLEESFPASDPVSVKQIT